MSESEVHPTNLFVSAADGGTHVIDCLNVPGVPCSSCIVGQTAPPFKSKYKLYKRNTSGNFVFVKEQTGKTFGGLSPGEYQVRRSYPRARIGCGGAPMLARSITGQVLGYIGALCPAVQSNSVFIGPSSNADVNISFANDFNNNAAYDLGTDVRINTAGTINHVRWKVYIWEAGGNWTNRYETPFFNGQIPPELSVDFLLGTGNVGPYTFSGFQPFKSYKIHVGVQGNCGGWGFKELQWFYCPTGLGCRPNLSETPLVVTPNPVQTYFHLVGDSEQERSSNQRVFIRDLSGRTVKEFYRDQIDRYEVGDLQTGIYIIQIIDPAAGLVYSSKMVKR